MKEIGFYIKVIQITIYFLTCLYSFQLYKKQNIPQYMKGFFWYPTAGCIVALVWILAKQNYLTDLTLQHVNSYSLLFHFSFLSYFIFRVVSNNRIKKLIILFFFTCLISLLITLFLDSYNTTRLPFNITNYGLFFCSLFYYYSLFQNIPKKNLATESSFWIITGIFIGMGLNIPIISFGYVFDSTSPYIIKTIGWIAPLGFIIMYILFLKGIQCTVHQRL